MGKLTKAIKQFVSYQEIIRSTKVTYWPRFIKHTYIKKANRISDYVRVPEDVSFQYLSIEKQSFFSSVSPYSAKIIAEANNILCGHTLVFNLTTKEIKDQWSTDPLTGYQWPLVFFADVRKITPQGILENKNDIKYPWELSNSHHLVILAEAYLITEDQKYRDEYFRLIQNWIDNNPVGMGVNWCCTMDVALRAINIIVSASIMMTADPSFGNDFQKYYDILYSHMLFIRDNLEYGFVKENHYLSDITGLKMLAQSFSGDKTANQILKFARNAFKEEICYQIYEDGADHEASTCYHCFVLELFAIGLATDEKLRRELSKKQWQRLERMQSFSGMLGFFAHYPIIGDNDSGRVLDLNGTGEFRKEILCFSQHIFGKNMEMPSSYDFLIQGQTRAYTDTTSNNHEIRIYEQSGFATINNEVIRLLVHSGNIGRKGKGGHGHNDISSLVMDVKRESFIIDPGSGVYERDLTVRHWFRSTAAHNCVYIEGIEQNGISPQKPFKMDHNTKASVSVRNDSIVCLHEGYKERLGIESKREIKWKDNTLYIDDYLIGNKTFSFSCCYTFAEEVNIEKDGTDIIAILPDQIHVKIMIPEYCQADLVERRYSPDYGVIKKTSGLLIACTHPTDHICVAFQICE